MVNRVPFIKINRLFTHYYRVSACLNIYIFLVAVSIRPLFRAVPVPFGCHTLESYMESWMLLCRHHHGTSVVCQADWGRFMEIHHMNWCGIFIHEE